MSTLHNQSPQNVTAHGNVAGTRTPSRKGSDETAVEARRRTLTRVIWIIVNILFLDFARKFEHRLEIYSNPDSTEQDVKEWREGQQDEWDRLGTTVSISMTITRIDNRL